MINGFLETTIRSDAHFDKSKSSDIVQASVEIAIDAELSQWVSTHILALYKNDADTTFGIDEAFINFGNDLLSPYGLTIGQQYLPFGYFATNLVSDPLTLALGETSNSAITVSYQNIVSIAVYAFKGEVILAEDIPTRDNINNQKIANFGINFGYVFEAKNFMLDFGVGYINSIAEANRLADLINRGPTSLPPDEPGTNGAGIENYIGGIASHLFIVWGNYSFIIDHVYATDPFAAQEIMLGKQAKPSAVNIEMALSINTAMTLAFGVQQTVDSIGLQLPETRALVGLSYALGGSSQIAVELLRDFDYSAKDGGTSGEATTILVNISAGF